MTRSGGGLAGRLRRSGLGRAALVWLAAGYLWLVARTLRWEVRGAAHLDGLARRPSAFLAAFWHGRIALSPLLAPEGRKVIAMISSNRDGAMIAAVAERFGVGAVRGSSFDRRKRRAKGATGAYRAALAVLERPEAILAVTPDGPRGPRMRAQSGIAHLSIASGRPVLPFAVSVRWGRVFRSWDRFLLPFPFARAVAVYGPPLPPPEDGEAGLERHRAAIEAALNAVTSEADRAVGRAPVTPAP